MINYFELYQIPVSLKPDASTVKSKFYELSRQYHPDRFATADDATRAEALRMAAFNNDAYKTLNNADATMAYVLKMNNVLEDEEKYNLPPDFLMEMMDLNEAVSEYELEKDNDTLKQNAIQQVQEQFQTWEMETAPLIARFTDGAKDTALLQQLKEQYFRKKYLLRIQQRIDTFAAR